MRVGCKYPVKRIKDKRGKMFVETSGLDQEDIASRMAECREKLDLVDADLMAFGGGEADVPQELINRVLGVFHSVHRAAVYLQHEPLKALSHITENVLGQVREGNLRLSSANVDVLLSAADRMRQMVEDDEPHTNVDFSGERKAMEEILLQCDNRVAMKPEKLVSAGIPFPPKAPAPSAEAASSPRLKVLIVEDDFTCRLTLQGLLQAYGECHVAVNGKEAIQAFTAARQSGKGYNLICMDINMPEMDGRTAVKAIREIEAREGIFTTGAKIFMTTASEDLKSVVASFQAICDAYLIKPIDGRKLKAELMRFHLIPPRT